MSGTHIFIGGLHPACRKSDVERFFAGYGRIKTLLLKRGYGFVEFGDSQDASDAVDILDGSELLGSKVTVAHAFPRQFRRYPSYGFRGEQARSGSLGFSKTTPMKRGAGYKVIVKNLSNRVKWQELKDFMRQAGEVAYADVYEELNEGIVEFRYYPDLKRAVEALDNSVLGGWRIRLIDKAQHEGSSSQNGKSRRINRCISRSRSRSPMRSRKRLH
uniref:RRM domain-containing protein n=2 Tax=Rhodnius prolixus TaxID=13249 RepID=T1IAW6_RHOPR